MHITDNNWKYYQLLRPCLLQFDQQGFFLIFIALGSFELLVCAYTNNNNLTWMKLMQKRHVKWILTLFMVILTVCAFIVVQYTGDEYSYAPPGMKGYQELMQQALND